MIWQNKMNFFSSLKHFFPIFIASFPNVGVGSTSRRKVCRHTTPKIDLETIYSGKWLRRVGCAKNIVAQL
jgi:hypothetical protein